MPTNPMHNWLNELGEARRAGVFAPQASGRLPWQVAKAPAVQRGVRGLRLAIPLAAAAAVAIVFVRPSFDDRAPTQLVSGERVAVTAALSTSQAQQLEDCNRDGQVNGKDIACFVSQYADRNESSALQAEALTRRLLGI